MQLTKKSISGENYWPALFQWKTLSHIGVSSTPCYEQYKLCTTFNKIVMCMREPVLFSNNKWILLVFCMFNHICCLFEFMLNTCDNMWSLWAKANLCRFVIVCLYMYCCWRSNYQEWRVRIPLSGLTPPHFCSCPKLEHGFPMSYIVILFHVQWVEVRAGCLFFYILVELLTTTV